MEPRPVDVDTLRAELGSRWASIEWVERTGSTNADLVADAAAPDRSVLIAEEQTAGRGRLDRPWNSPPGAGLTFSVLLRPTAPVPTWGWLPLLAGVALRDAVVALGVPAWLKWPNDLLLGADERKVAGILVQSSGAAVVIGIGLNVTTSAADLPTPEATSLALAGATTLDRTELLQDVLTRLDSRVAQWSDVGGDAEACGLAAAYRDGCSSIGRDVTVTITDGTVVYGTATGIDADGRLRLRTTAGERLIGAGDLRHLRPAG